MASVPTVSTPFSTRDPALFAASFTVSRIFFDMCQDLFHALYSLVSQSLDSIDLQRLDDVDFTIIRWRDMPYSGYNRYEPEDPVIN